MIIKRYGLGRAYVARVGTPTITEQPDGDYVLYVDYQRMEAAATAHADLMALRAEKAEQTRGTNCPEMPDSSNGAPEAHEATTPPLPTEHMVVAGFEAVSMFRDTDAFKELSGCQGAAESARICWAAMVAEMPEGATPRQDLLPSAAAIQGVWAEECFARHEAEAILGFARILFARYGAAQPDHSEDLRHMVDAQPGELDALGEQCNRLQDALAFYMPDVPEAGHPLHERIAQDAYLLCGYDGSGSNEPSAQELGFISLSAAPTPPADGHNEIKAIHAAAHHVGWAFTKYADGVVRMVPLVAGEAQAADGQEK